MWGQEADPEPDSSDPLKVVEWLVKESERLFGLARVVDEQVAAVARSDGDIETMLVRLDHDWSRCQHGRHVQIYLKDFQEPVRKLVLKMLSKKSKALRDQALRAANRLKGMLKGSSLPRR